MAFKKSDEVKVEITPEDLLNDTELTVERPVEDVRVLFMPLKDFEARVNQEVFPFRTGVRTWVSRDLAATLSNDPKNGYVMES